MTYILLDKLADAEWLTLFLFSLNVDTFVGNELLKFCYYKRLIAVELCTAVSL